MKLIIEQILEGEFKKWAGDPGDSSVMEGESITFRVLDGYSCVPNNTVEVTMSLAYVLSLYEERAKDEDSGFRTEVCMFIDRKQAIAIINFLKAVHDLP